VNSARWVEEQNMVGIEIVGKIYYILFKDVKAGQELFGGFSVSQQQIIALATK
jgi:hypothetical protein